jgi:hypothetical protein
VEVKIILLTMYILRRADNCLVLNEKLLSNRKHVAYYVCLLVL